MSNDVDTRVATALTALYRTLGGMAANIPEPVLAGPLKHFADALEWSAHSLESDERVKANEKLIDGLLAEANSLLDEAGRPIPADGPDEVARSVEALVFASEAGVPGARALLDQLLTTITYVETGVAQGPEAVPAGPSAPARLTPDQVAAYLRRHYGDEDVVVESVTTIGGGYSKHTVLVDATWKGERQEIVLRQVPPGQPDDTLAPEYAVLRHVWSPELPIAEPLWIEAPSELGGPFFASRKADGSTFGTVEGAQTAVPASFCEDLAGFLARLHAIDPTGLTTAPVPPMRTAEEIRVAIDQMAAKAVAATGTTSPRLAAVLAWLHANIPDRVSASIVHGDVGLHNALSDGERLTAVLDWERAHLGDPVEDLAYLRPSVEPVYPWEDFIDCYIAHGGARPDPAAERFYTVWQDTWRHIECVRLSEDFFASGSIPMLIAGMVLGPRFLASAQRSAFGSEGGQP
ncbi:MAG TPA: phosphotransferase family protein [Acidimicrobiia bacterium]|nr:phosphotransferase family protein [Acidimicrobiia bacterium]